MPTPAPDPNKPLIEAPALAFVWQKIVDRPPWLRPEPITIPADLFEQARSEMAAVLKRRGWALPAETGRPGFMLHGVYVVRQ